MSKKIDLSTISIDRIIVHDIPKHNKNILTIEPSYSQEESQLTDGLRLFFKDKVVQALASDKAFKICYDDANDSPISWLTTEMLKLNGTNIVEQSLKMTKYLFEIQVGSNAAGIIVIIFGKVNSLNSCIILKLERDKGAQLTLNPKTKSFNIAEVENLMLTQKTRIFKVVLFIQREDFNSKYDGLIMDYQINVKNKKEVTTWFIEKFLGCQAFEDPKIITQHFYNYTKSFIYTLDNEIDKVKYIQDLNSYIQKNDTTLSPRVFADDYLKTTEHRNNYKQFLDSKKFNFSAFIKDSNQINSQINKIILTFENDISIIGNKGTFKKEVKLKKMNNGQTKAEITSKIRKVV